MVSVQSNKQTKKSEAKDLEREEDQIGLFIHALFLSLSLSFLSPSVIKMRLERKWREKEREIEEAQHKHNLLCS